LPEVAPDISAGKALRRIDFYVSLASEIVTVA
jgi:hypothetical protein